MKRKVEEDSGLHENLVFHLHLMSIFESALFLT